MLAAAYTAFGATAYWAAHCSRRPDEWHLRRAVRLQPRNSEYRHQLGLYDLFALQDVNAAATEFRQAISLNPHLARYWLDLANAKQVIGDVDGQRHAIQQAVDAEPTNYPAAWEAANLLFAAGDVVRGLQVSKLVLQANPDRRVVDVCWRAARDPELIVHNALPSTASAHLLLLNFLVDQGEIDNAGKVWSELLNLRQKFETDAALPYVEQLLKRREVEQARQVWKSAVAADSASPPETAAGNLVVNSNFEGRLLNGGFDWRFPSDPNTRVTLDSAEFRTAGRSLQVAFSGEPMSGPAMYQLIPVEPDTSYDFSAYVKTEEIYTSSGPRFLIEDAYTAQPLAQTKPVVGTVQWNQDKIEFRTGPETRLLKLSLVQSPAGHIRGRMWVDELMLSRN